MRICEHPLPQSSSGTRRSWVSLHFGPDDRGRKAYLQAGLHADEVPGMLVMHHLRHELARIEAAGGLLGEVVLVPISNPIGLGQRLLHQPIGRFELASSHNFNRYYPDLTPAVADRVATQLGPDPASNRRAIRQALGEQIALLPQDTELAALRRGLMQLAHDADIVLDLHCDAEAVVHLYTENPCWPGLEPLARLLGARAVLLNQQAGGHSFDEACGSPWWRLAEQFSGRFPVPQACLDATVELRGQADVDHGLAQQDAGALLQFLCQAGLIYGPAPDLPPARCVPTPLAGSEVLKAPCSGVVVFRRQVGDDIRAGQTVCDIVDPLSAQVTELKASVDGVLYARTRERHAQPGMDLADIAGPTPIRSGWLLSA
ncbi:MAG: succinylglutamate desuccinylase [Rhodoferax sp.]|nr:succinylglutamate desuccinylase [Rhodoferax sp.]